MNCYPATSFSPIAAAPKYLMEHAIGGYWPSHIAQVKYGCMRLSFKSASFHIGPKGDKWCELLLVLQLVFLPLAAASPKYLMEHVIGWHRCSHMAQVKYGCMSVFIQVSFLLVLAKKCHGVNCYPPTSFSPTTAAPKYLMEHAMFFLLI